MNSLPDPSDASDNPLREYFVYMEEYCVYYCCGLDAFNLDADVSVNYVGDYGAETAQQVLQSLREIRQLMTPEVFERHGIDYRAGEMTDADFRFLLEKAETNLALALQQTQNP